MGARRKRHDCLYICKFRPSTVVVSSALRVYLHAAH